MPPLCACRPYCPVSTPPHPSWWPQPSSLFAALSVHPLQQTTAKALSSPVFLFWPCFHPLVTVSSTVSFFPAVPFSNITFALRVRYVIVSSIYFTAIAAVYQVLTRAALQTKLTLACIAGEEAMAHLWNWHAKSYRVHRKQGRHSSQFCLAPNKACRLSMSVHFFYISPQSLQIQ